MCKVLVATTEVQMSDMSDDTAPEIFITGVGYLTITTTIGGRVKIPNSEGAWVVCDDEHLFVPLYADMTSIVSPEMLQQTLTFICLSRTITEEEILLLKKRLSQKKGQRVVANN